MVHLQSISLKPASKRQSSFPFDLPLVKNFDRIEFNSPVTFFVGENGSGKSTLLEAIGAGVKLATVGGDDVERDETLEGARALGRRLKFSWLNKTHRGFFLRAEDFFNFARRLQAMTRELREIADSFDEEYAGYALGLAKGAALGQRQALIERYGENLDANADPDGLSRRADPELRRSSHQGSGLRSRGTCVVDAGFFEKPAIVLATAVALNSRFVYSKRGVENWSKGRRQISRRAACNLVVEYINSLSSSRGGGMADTEDLSCLK